MLKALFFDFDGVIAESVDIKTKAFGRLFEKEGPDIVKKVVEYHSNNTGVSRYDKFRYFYKNFLNRPLPEAEFKRLCGEFEKLVVDEVVAAPFVKGASEFLEKHSGSYANYIVSATPQQEIEDIVRRKGLARFFKEVFGAPTRKKDAVKAVLEKLGIPAGEALYVGDAMSDLEAARSNGVHFIARVYKVDAVFSGTDCVKMKDLRGLNEALSGY
jgi:phosphoglycolate phosphatase-like HAD superfamily hydrolase